MATIRKEVLTPMAVDDVWDAVRDIGALHTRLVPGFVLDTRLDGTVRSVTFANGTTLREPIVAIDEENRRLVWTAEGGRTTHYNAALQVFAENGGSRLVWVADFLPDAISDAIEAAMEAGMQAMRRALRVVP